MAADYATSQAEERYSNCDLEVAKIFAEDSSYTESFTVSIFSVSSALFIDTCSLK